MDPVLKPKSEAQAPNYAATLPSSQTYKVIAEVWCSRQPLEHQGKKLKFIFKEVSKPI